METVTLSGDDLSRCEDFERDLLDRLPIEAQHVPQSKTDKYDAILESAFYSTPPIPLVDQIALWPGTPIELKTWKRWITDRASNGGRRRGQFKINESTHSNLVEIGGGYIFVVLEPESGEILGGRTYHAADLPSIKYHRSGDQYSSKRATVSWPIIVPLEKVDQ